MSDQDEISRLLAEANAQAEAAPVEQAPTPQPVNTPRKQPPKIVGRNSDVLGVAWFHGALHAAAFRRQKMTRSWSSTTAVRTVPEFEAVIDDALAALEFEGTEMFILLENELFSHQTENVPAFSAAAARTYLKGRIQRHEQENGQVLWVAQPAAAAKDATHSIILHLLPASFYDELNRVLLARHLDLTRILPLIVPLHYEMNRIPVDKDTPVIAVAEAGASTCVVVGRVGGPLLLSRTILANLSAEGGRVGVEVNRSLLFAKQQFDCAVDRIWLMAESPHAAADIRAKCGAARKVMSLPTTAVDWLQTCIKLSPQQPINLLAGYLRTKRRHRIIRAAVLAAAWLGLLVTVAGLTNKHVEWSRERGELAALASREDTLLAQRQQLTLRNETVGKNQQLIDLVQNHRLGPVPARLLAYIPTVLPPSSRLVEFGVRKEPDTSGWSFRIDGVIEGDEETARDALLGTRNQLGRSPLRARFNETTSGMVAAPAAANTLVDIQRFSLEGVILE